MNQTPYIYLDYAASAPLLPQVRQVMFEAEERYPGNPSSIHQPGQRVRTAIELARTAIAAGMGAQPSEIIFTSGATESNHAILWGVLQPGDHVITSTIEHPAIHRPLQVLLQRGIASTQVAAQSDGTVRPGDVAAELRPETRLITIMAVNNETGAVNDLDALGKLAAGHNLLLHTDGVQALGKLPLDVHAQGIHYLSASAHKLGGPRGMGLLYIRQGAPFDAVQLGGSQEAGRRGGTENPAAILGFAEALRLTLEHRESNRKHYSALRRAFLQQLHESQVACQVNADGSPAILNLSFSNIDGHALVIRLDQAGIAASYGSSCSSGAAKMSHVLIAMGLSAGQAARSVRFSFGQATTLDEVRQTARTIAGIVNPKAD